VIEVPFNSPAFSNGHSDDDLVSISEPYSLSPPLEKLSENIMAHTITPLGQRRGLNNRWL